MFHRPLVGRSAFLRDMIVGYFQVLSCLDAHSRIFISRVSPSVGWSVGLHFSGYDCWIFSRSDLVYYIILYRAVLYES